MKLRGKFTLAFLACGLTPLLLATLFSHGIVRHAFEDMGQRSHDALEREVKSRLRGQLQGKRYQLETYANSLRAETVVMTRVRFFGQMFMQMREGYRKFRADGGITPKDTTRQRAALAGIYEDVFSGELAKRTNGRKPDMSGYIAKLSPDAVAVQYAFLRQSDEEEGPADDWTENSAYGELRAMGGQYWSDAMTKLGFHDLMLVEAGTGEVVFTAAGGIDLGASLMDGPLGASGAGQAFRDAMEMHDPSQPVFADAAPYLPAYGDPSCFLAIPIHTPFGTVGAAVFRIGTERLDAIMGGGISMGETGETLLVGPDFLLRSDAQRDTTGRYTVRNAFLNPMAARIDMPAVHAIFERGESGLGIGPDYLGHETLFAYAPVDMLGVPWGLIAKVDTKEAFAAMEDINHSARTYIEAMVRLSDIVVAGAIVLLVVAALLIARPIAQPLRSTVAVLKDMAEGEGDPSVRLEVTGKDEVGDLARWFNAFMGKLEGVYGELADEVAERKRAQNDLERSEQYYRALIENAPDVIAVIDRNFHACYLSPAFERTFGYPIDEVLGNDLIAYLAPDDQADLRKRRDAEGFVYRTPVRMERRARHRDGHWLDIEVTVTPYDEGDVIRGTVLNMRDITERKRAEEEVTRLASFPHENPSPVMAFDGEAEMAYANPATEEMAGKLGVTPTDLLPPHHEDTVRQCSISGEGAELEYAVGDRTLSIRYNPVAAAGLVHVYVRDITSRKRAEAVLREYSETLERDVAERTVELRTKSEDLARALAELQNTQDRLILNEKMASLGALTAGIAHEIKNPLNFVNNFAELVLELTDDIGGRITEEAERLEADARSEIDEMLADLRQSTEKIMEHGKRADSIVRSMLLHSRGVAGARHKTNINELLDEYVKLAYHGMRARDAAFNIEIVVDYAPELPTAEIVPQDVARAFLNIINNACYAAHERARSEGDGFQPRIEVHSRDAGDAVEVRIRDNGNGIPAESLDDIFTPFYTTKPAGEGTGLGLSISHDIIVRGHGGEIRVVSTPGEFTEFIIRLPKHAARQQEQDGV